MKPRSLVMAAMLAAALVAGALILESRRPHPPVILPRQMQQTEELPRLWRIPDFSFPDQDGRTVTPADLRNRPFIADFIFTQCRSACPILTARMMLLQRKLAGTDVQFVSYSVDPANDTSEALKAYAQQWSGDESRWRLMRTRPDSLRAIAAGFRVMVGASGIADDPIMHTAKFFLVDGVGFVRGFYDSTEEDEIQRLVADAKSIAGSRAHGADLSRGAALFTSLGCRGCHARPEVAPPLGGVFGKQVKLADGKTVTADEAYLRESISSPQAKIVAGYGQTMPSYDHQMSDAQVASLVGYLESLPAPAARVAARHTEIDPVCGMEVSVSDEDPYVERNGRRYWFCNDDCRKQFLAQHGRRMSKGVSERR